MTEDNAYYPWQCLSFRLSTLLLGREAQEEQRTMGVGLKLWVYVRDPGRQLLWGLSPGEAVELAGEGWGAASWLAAVARDERPRVGLLADGQAGQVEAWGWGRGR